LREELLINGLYNLGTFATKSHNLTTKSCNQQPKLNWENKIRMHAEVHDIYTCKIWQIKYYEFGKCFDDLIIMCHTFLFIKTFLYIASKYINF